MRYLALALLLLTGCESAKLRPWIAITERSGSSLGIDRGANRFTNVGFGDELTFGIALEIPLGPATIQRIRIENWAKPSWPDLPPRYEFVKAPNLPNTPRGHGDLGPPIEDDGIKGTVKEIVEGGNLWGYVFLGVFVLIALIVMQKVGLLKGKNGGKADG